MTEEKMLKQQKETEKANFKADLDAKIKRYKEINAELEKLDAEKKKLSEYVATTMIKDNLSEIIVGEGPDALIASYGSKITFKYTDENGIIKYIKDNKLDDKYLETSIITTALNAELKNPDTTLVESLSKFYDKKVSYSLTIMLKSDYDEKVAPKKIKK